MNVSRINKNQRQTEKESKLISLNDSESRTIILRILKFNPQFLFDICANSDKLSSYCKEIKEARSIYRELKKANLIKFIIKNFKNHHIEDFANKFLQKARIYISDDELISMELEEIRRKTHNITSPYGSSLAPQNYSYRDVNGNSLSVRYVIEAPKFHGENKLYVIIDLRCSCGNFIDYEKTKNQIMTHLIEVKDYSFSCTQCQKEFVVLSTFRMFLTIPRSIDIRYDISSNVDFSVSNELELQKLTKEIKALEQLEQVRKKAQLIKDRRISKQLLEEISILTEKVEKVKILTKQFNEHMEKMQKEKETIERLVQRIKNEKKELLKEREQRFMAEKELLSMGIKLATERQALERAQEQYKKNVGYVKKALKNIEKETKAIGKAKEKGIMQLEKIRKDQDAIVTDRKNVKREREALKGERNNLKRKQQAFQKASEAFEAQKIRIQLKLEQFHKEKEKVRREAMGVVKDRLDNKREKEANQKDRIKLQKEREVIEEEKERLSRFKKKA